jgi:hypothetical protein
MLILAASILQYYHPFGELFMGVTLRIFIYIYLELVLETIMVRRNNSCGSMTYQASC